jgi:hypothetical protein
MWVCLNNAFISIVKADGPGDLMLVRARKKAHLKELFPREKIIERKARDYRFRVIVKREAVANLLLENVMKINYSNFKDSVKNNELHDLYLDFWHLHLKYQRGFYKRGGGGFPVSPLRGHRETLLRGA